jgi:uncharacterized protein (DUF488 family)
MVLTHHHKKYITKIYLIKVIRSIYMILSTIGYQGTNVDDFFQVLIQNEIEIIIDIREYPISRKKGFSKSALSQLAETYDILYIHFNSLGCPREIRNDYRQDRDWDRYSRRFLSYLETKSDEVDKLAKLVQLNNSCLLCFEANPDHCHRIYVADEISSRLCSDIAIKHLEPLNEANAVWPEPSGGKPNPQ